MINRLDERIREVEAAACMAKSVAAVAAACAVLAAIMAARR